MALIPATGSTRMGRIVGPKVTARFGRSILEPGGNNAGIVCPSADLDMVLQAIAFGAMGTAGQRRITLRRLLVHESACDALVTRMIKADGSVTVCNPLETAALVGPVVDGQAFDLMQKVLDGAKAAGGTVHGSVRVAVGTEADCYSLPALVEMPEQNGPVLKESFAPILYVMKYKGLSDAIRLHNAVGAGLTSSISTLDMHDTQTFPAAAGSDCGIADVNIGISGAEVGGAVGGEK